MTRPHTAAGRARHCEGCSGSVPVYGTHSNADPCRGLAAADPSGLTSEQVYRWEPVEGDCTRHFGPHEGFRCNGAYGRLIEVYEAEAAADPSGLRAVSALVDNVPPHEHEEGCGHNGEGVEPLYLRGWRDGRSRLAEQARAALAATPPASRHTHAGEFASCYEDHSIPPASGPLDLLRALVAEVGDEPITDNRARRMTAWIKARNWLEKHDARLTADAEGRE